MFCTQPGSSSVFKLGLRLQFMTSFITIGLVIWGWIEFLGSFEVGHGEAGAETHSVLVNLGIWVIYLCIFVTRSKSFINSDPIL